MKKRLPFIIAAILATLFIFYNSSLSAEESSADSSVIADFVEDTAEQLGKNPDRADIVRAVRKGAHIAEFAIQGILLAGCFSIAFRRRIIYVLVFGLLTACTDEFIQLFSDGRASMIRDVFIDIIGTAFGLLIYGLFIKILYKKKLRKGT